MKNTKFLFGTIAAISITGAALAHGGATGIVKERMDGMSAMGNAVKVLSEMMRGNVDYDPEVVKENALKIQVHAGEQLSKLFPEGAMAVRRKQNLRYGPTGQSLKRYLNN